MKISIVTINYNNANGLKRTINSVVSQSYYNIEYIIIDGGSSDGSTDLIKAHEDGISYWVSEKDKGIYDAMNKGVEVASGEYLLFLNSGDVLLNSDTISSVLSKTENTPADIIYGNLISVDSTGKEEPIIYPSKLSFDYFLYQSLPHPATLINKSLFKEYGAYDSNLRICADWKFFLLMICKHNRSYTYLDIAISKYEMGGVSSNMEMVRAEQALVFKKEFPNFIEDYIKLEQLRAFHKRITSSKLIRFLNKTGFISINETKKIHPFKITE